jgi:hypothetical protein
MDITMNLTSANPIPSLAARQPAGMAMRSNPAAFAATLASEKSKYSEAKTAAEQLVATTFVVPLLKRFRESSNAAAPFAPTSAEKSLRSLADTNLAESIVRKSNWPLVDRLAQRMLSKGGSATTTEPTSTESST